MSAWADVDALKRDRFATARGATKARLDRSMDSTWHARLVARCYRYTTLDGEVREWLQHQLAHAHDFRRVAIVAACFPVLGAVPMLDGEKANRLTQNRLRVTCGACINLLDAEIESGRLKFDEKGRFILGALATPLYEMSSSATCRLCGKNRETCGHFVGGGAL